MVKLPWKPDSLIPFISVTFSKKSTAYRPPVFVRITFPKPEVHAILKGLIILLERLVILMAKNESAENYLETILILSKRLPVVRSVDIANELDFKKSSVSIAMKNLREKNQITVTDSGFIYLTNAGKEIAEMIYERHEFLSSWLESLGVDHDTAIEDACKMEHVISKQSFEAIKKLQK